MLELIEGLPRSVVGILATGRVTMRDCQDVLLPALKKSRRRHDKIRLYYELNSRFPGSAWDDLDLGLETCRVLREGRDRHRHRLGASHRQSAALPDTLQDTGIPDHSGRRRPRLDHRPSGLPRG